MWVLSILLLFCFEVGWTAPLPISNFETTSQITAARHDPDHQHLRGFWDFLVNWIQGSQFFPIQINVPDTLGSIGNGINGLIQRIPFVNQRPVTRPLMLLLPMDLQKSPSSDVLGNLQEEEGLPYP